jgi:hypothetical protein
VTFDSKPDLKKLLHHLGLVAPLPSGFSAKHKNLLARESGGEAELTRSKKCWNRVARHSPRHCRFQQVSGCVSHDQGVRGKTRLAMLGTPPAEHASA